MALIICFVCGTLGATSAARSAPDIRTLLTQLNHLSTTDRAAREILQAAGEDSSARQYVVQQLPEMINKPEVNEIWLNAVRLAGKLKATEPIPSLRKALSRGPLGGPLNTTFTTQIDLDDDVVAKALSEIGDPAIPAVTDDLLSSGDQKKRRRAVLILRNMGSPAARKVLQDRLPHENDPRIKELIETGLRS